MVPCLFPLRSPCFLFYSFITLLLQTKKNSSTLLCPGSISKLLDLHHFQGSVVCIQILKDKIALRLRSMASLVVEFQLVTATDAWREKEERILPGSLNRTACLDTSSCSVNQAEPSYFLPLPDHWSGFSSGTMNVCFQDATHSLLDLQFWAHPNP